MFLKPHWRTISTAERRMALQGLSRNVQLTKRSAKTCNKVGNNGGQLLYFVEYIYGDMTTVHLIITGKVQGVFYRANAKQKADTMGITGWVKNMDEGHVELLASGTTEDIDAYIAWCKQGPPKATVTSVTVTKQDHQLFKGFAIRG